jgi:hypothetical protein
VGLLQAFDRSTVSAALVSDVNRSENGRVDSNLESTIDGSEP